ncbi:MAG: hypothetical protein ACRERC_08190 [Candidatus Binatia bacterium]
MNRVRLLRIAGFALALPFAFSLSQQAAELRGGEQAPGMLIAVGVLSVVFLLRALASEYGSGPEANLQKDLQWGLAVGGVITILSNL